MVYIYSLASMACCYTSDSLVSVFVTGLSMFATWSLGYYCGMGWMHQDHGRVLIQYGGTCWNVIVSPFTMTVTTFGSHHSLIPLYGYAIAVYWLLVILLISPISLLCSSYIYTIYFQWTHSQSLLIPQLRVGAVLTCLYSLVMDSGNPRVQQVIPLPLPLKTSTPHILD